MFIDVQNRVEAYLLFYERFQHNFSWSTAWLTWFQIQLLLNWVRYKAYSRGEYYQMEPDGVLPLDTFKFLKYYAKAQN